MRIFTREEAEALIPELEKIFDDVAELAARAQAKANEARGLEEKTARPADLALAKSQLRFLTGQIEERLQGIFDLGAMPKGLEPALVDFPGYVDGREVLLCWKLGEKSIDWYHGADEGFGGRRPLPKRRLS